MRNCATSFVEARTVNLISHHDILNIALGVVVAVGALGGLWAIYLAHRKLDHIMAEVTKKRTLIALVFMLLASPAHAAMLTLIWNDGSDNECGFTLERRSPKQTDWQIVAWIDANQRKYEDIGLTTGERYRYRLSAFNAFGQSAYSNEASGVATRPDPTPQSVTKTPSVIAPCAYWRTNN